MRQLHDDDLILYFYGEADGAEIDNLLAGSADLRTRYDALCRTLEMTGEGFPVPARLDSYGAEVWARVKALLPEGLDATSQAKVLHLRPLTPLAPLSHPLPSSGRGGKSVSRRGWWRPSPGGREGMGEGTGVRGRLAGLAAAAVVLLVVGFVAGRFWPGPAATRVPTQVAFSAEARQRILVHTVAAHLERSERLFTELANGAATGSVDVSAERQWARDLLAANRLYRQSTLQSGRPRLTSLLDELEPFLLELSHGPNEIPAGEIADFRARIAERSLLFKLRIVSQRLERTTL
jgi:hypothetical protein